MKYEVIYSCLAFNVNINMNAPCVRFGRAINYSRLEPRKVMLKETSPTIKRYFPHIICLKAKCLNNMLLGKENPRSMSKYLLFRSLDTFGYLNIIPSSESWDMIFLDRSARVGIVADCERWTGLVIVCYFWIIKGSANRKSYGPATLRAGSRFSISIKALA